MRVFPAGSSNLLKTGVFWGIVFGISILSAVILGVMFGEETMEQCGPDYTGEVNVTNCEEYDSYSSTLMFPMVIFITPAMIYSVLGFMEYKRKKTLTVVMGAHGSKSYMKLERLLKIVNKNPSEENLLELQNVLYATCNPLMSYLTSEDGTSVRLERSDVLEVATLNVIFNTVAAAVEPAAAVHDEAVRLQKMQIKAAQKQAAAEHAHQQNMMDSMTNNQPSAKKGSMTGSVAKGVGTFMMGGARHTYYCRKCGSVRSAKSLEPKMCCGMNMKKQK